MSFKILGKDLLSFENKPSLEGFKDYLRSRFNQMSFLLKNIISKKQVPIVDLARLKAEELTEICYVVARVYQCKLQLKGYSVILDDLTGNLSFFIGQKHELFSVFSEIFADLILGFGIIIKDEKVILKEVIFPKEKAKEIVRAKNLSPIRLVTYSDVHIGSKTFFSKEFESSIDYVNSQKDIKYVIIAGDLCDGTNVYPGHKIDLHLTTVTQQYIQAGRYFSLFRPDITIFFSVGNHDLSTQIEPQKPVPQRIKDLMPSNVIFLPNPVFIELEGVKSLIYHGRTLDELVSLIDHFSYERPAELMSYLLKIRHLSPRYSKRSINFNFSKDLHVIEEVPHLFITGHIHHNCLSFSDNTLLINSGTWQNKTKFQKRVGFSPTPCRLTVVNLMDLKDNQVIPFLEDHEEEVIR